MINYYTDGKGRWVKQEFAKQCKHKVVLSRRCQGVQGHEGDHWCYGTDGSYHWEVNDYRKIKSSDIAGGITPPENDGYISPIDKAKDYYMSNHTETEVTDAKTIARLEKGKIKDGESIDRPVDEKEIGRRVEDE